jgi:Fe-S cluster assembly iron-binding protein IscA
MGMALDEPKDNERPIDVNGIGVLIEEKALPLVDGLTVDYVIDPDGEGFTISGGADCSC